jgi:hypothetical protein
MADEPNLVEIINGLVAAMKADFAAHCEKMDARYDALDAKMKKSDAAGMRRKKADEDGMAEETAADSISRGEFRAVQEQLNVLKVRDGMSLDRQSQSTRDSYADAQAKADAVLRAHGESAAAPMSGEDIVAYQVRLHRPMLKHAKKFKNADLATIARDASTFAAVLDSVRADTYEAALNPVGLAPFVHREIKSESSGGHKITQFVGNGTIFKQLCRPARYVTSLNISDKFPRSAGGSFLAS